MAQPVCCVDRVHPATRSLGGRWFCDEHYARATYHRRRMWRSSAITFGSVLALVAVMVGLDALLLPELTGPAPLLLGVVLAVLPAALWLLFFYRLDRLEPEPVGYVARMFVIGLALAGALGMPLVDQLFHIQAWLYRDPLTTALGSIFVIGAVEAFIVYAAVRFFIFDDPEFDERIDGVIYGMAAGIGYATALNLQFILSNGGAAPGAGQVFMAEVALAQAAFGGLLGYFLGRARLDITPAWWLPAGLLLTAVLHGLFAIMRGKLETGSITFGAHSSLPSLAGLLLAGGLAVLVSAIVALLINRDIARSLGDRQPPATSDPGASNRRANLSVITTFGVMLLVGTFAWNQAVYGTVAFERGSFTGAYPAYYGDATADGEVLRVVDTLGTGAQFLILQLMPADGLDADAVAAQLADERSADFTSYKVVARGLAPVGGKTAVVQRFVYVDPKALTNAPPQVKQGIDYIFTGDTRPAVVTLLTTPEDLADVEPLFTRFVDGLSF